MSRKTEIAELRDQAAQAHTEAIRARQNFDEGDDAARAAARSTFDKAMDKYDELTAKANKMQAEEDADARRADRAEKASETLARPELRESSRDVSPGEAADDEAKYDMRVFGRILRGGASEEDREIYRHAQEVRLAPMLQQYGIEALPHIAHAVRTTIVTDGATGSAVLPVEVAERVDVAIALTGPMGDPAVVTFIDNFVGSLRLPTLDASDETATGAAQDTQSTEDASTIGNLLLHPEVYQTQHVPISFAAIEDGGEALFDQMLETFFGEGMGRAVNTDGSINGAANKISGAFNGNAAAQVVDVANADQMTWTEFVSMVDTKLDQVYQQGQKSFVMLHRSTAGMLSELKTDGQPNWREFDKVDLETRMPTVRGIPVRYNNALVAASGVAGTGPAHVTFPAATASDAVLAAAGDFARFVLVRGPNGVRIARDASVEWTANNILYKGLARYDGGRLQDKAFVVVHNA